MSKKIIRPNDINRSMGDGRLISSIVNNKCVLIVGSEIMLSKNKYAEYAGDSHRMIFENLREWLVENNVISKQHIANTFTQLSKDIRNVDMSVRELLADIHNFPISDMPDLLVELIRTRFFRLVLTTTIDPYIYNLMREVWGDELRVMDIYGDNWENSYDFDKEVATGDILSMPPTLYYVFGMGFSLTSRKTRFAINDNDYIEVISKWMSNLAPTRLLKYIHSRRLVALGCKFDDWFFRFFWYMLRGNIPGLTEGEVAISLSSESETDCKLKEYFEYSRINFELNSDSFIQATIDGLNQYLLEETQLICNQRKTGEIFISYAHEDKEIVKRIFYRLNQDGRSVWLDHERMQGGNEFDNEIAQAIGTCKVFMPILSSQVQEDLVNNNRRYYRNTEWAQVQAYKNTDAQSIEVIPIRLPGYDVRNRVVQDKLPKCIRDVTPFDLEERCIETLIEIINSKLSI